MSRAAAGALAAVLVLAPALAAAQAPARGDSIVAACMAKDTATMWSRVAARWSADSDSRWANDSLRRALLALGRADQAVRPASHLADSMVSPDFAARMARRDSADARALQTIIDRFGWPTRSLVGVAAADAAFFIAQHNTSLHEEALALMRALPAGEYSPTEFAMLEDRVRVGKGLPQRYGTQLSVAGAGPMRFDSIEDLSGLAARRAAAGLPPLDLYRCMIGGMYGRPVLDPMARR